MEGGYGHTHFTDEETEGQRGPGTGPVVQPGSGRAEWQLHF